MHTRWWFKSLLTEHPRWSFSLLYETNKLVFAPGCRISLVKFLLIISTWKSSGDWEAWVKTRERQQVQDKIDALLGGETQYEIYHYGFKE